MARRTKAEAQATRNALIDAAEAKLRLEAEWTARLTAGESIRDIFKLG